MHRVFVNQAQLGLTLRPHGPVLIKGGAGEAAADPSLPDMAFVRTGPNADQVYFPGASLKGVIRSHCERIVRTVGPPGSADLPQACCEILNERDHCGACTHDLAPAEVYDNSCFICQLFGHQGLASHVEFADAMCDDPSEAVLEERNGVAIDRVFGSVAVGPFQYEVLVSGTFHTTLTLRNFTCAHFGLLLLAWHDLKDHLLRLGSGKSRGLGQVDVCFETLRLHCYGASAEGRFRDLLAGEVAIPGSKTDSLGRSSWEFLAPDAAQDVAAYWEPIFAPFGAAWAERVATWKG